MGHFNKNKKIIQEDTIKLIHETFRDLRSAEGAFDLLQKFKNVATLDKISEIL
jgi:dynein heavy chain